jgi:hypothetical protein
MLTPSIYIFHISQVKKFTSKMKKVMLGLRSTENYFLFFIISDLYIGEKFQTVHYSLLIAMCTMTGLLMCETHVILTFVPKTCTAVQLRK